MPTTATASQVSDTIRNASRAPRSGSVSTCSSATPRKTVATMETPKVVIPSP
ncbi:hypothetical protein ACFQL1_13915 [Halomicroarcula sp. GCM10025709]|uniref:hypothetical protein n=1 Tax=Halomicroarcula sp. GCM10025709 TaxID=3252669 RepID=UPI00360AC173